VSADGLEFEQEPVVTVRRRNDDELGIRNRVGDFPLLARSEEAVGLDADDESGWQEGEGVRQCCGRL
jgi:hypothetical protein